MTRRSLLTAVGLVWIALSCHSMQAQFLPAASNGQEGSYGDATVLVPGEPIDQVLPGGGSHSYKISLNSGQYVRLLIAPSGAELGTTLYAPDGQRLSQFTCRQKGPTPVSTIAVVSGTYRLEVRSLEKDGVPGRYQMKVEEVRPATALDIHRIAAESLQMERSLQICKR
jgi:hypothetical protein